MTNHDIIFKKKNQVIHKNSSFTLLFKNCYIFNLNSLNTKFTYFTFATNTKKYILLICNVNSRCLVTIIQILTWAQTYTLYNMEL